MARVLLRALTGLILAAAIASAQTTTTQVSGTLDWNVLKAQIKSQHDANSVIYASEVTTMDSTGYVGASTGSYGVKNPLTTDSTQPPVYPDSPMKGGTLGEILVAIVVQKFITLGILDSNNTINSQYLPGGQDFIHPKFTTSSLTINQLLTHTSGIQDSALWSSSPSRKTSGSTAGDVVADITSWGTEFFITTGTGTAGTTVREDIWNTNLAVTPGSTGAYSYAATNIGLLAYICQQIIASRPTLVVGPKTLGAYMQEQIFSPLGMINTYFLLPDGQNPYIESLLIQTSGKKVVERTAAGGLQSFTNIHAAYPAQDMLMTNAADITKLMRALYIDTNSDLFTVGTLLRATIVGISDTSRNAVGVGYGVLRLDSTTLCSSWSSFTAYTECPYSSDREIWGYVSVAETSAWAAVCTTSPASTTATTVNTLTTSCTTTAQASNFGSITSPENVLRMATGAFDQIYIDRGSSGTSSTAIITADTQTRSAFFGFSVFVGILAVIFVVLLAAYFVEYLVQPAPVAGSITADAYRKPPPPEFD